MKKKNNNNIFKKIQEKYTFIIYIKKTGDIYIFIIDKEKKCKGIIFVANT